MLSMYRTGAGTSTGDYVGVDLTVDLNTSAVPLPAAFPLFATGLGILGFVARQRRLLPKFSREVIDRPL
jgi:hypothetical protein